MRAVSALRYTSEAIKLTPCLHCRKFLKHSIKPDELAKLSMGRSFVPNLDSECNYCYKSKEKFIVVSLLWAKMLVLVASTVPLSLADRCHENSYIQTHFSKQLT